MLGIIKSFLFRKNVRLNENIGQKTWFRTGGHAKIFFEPKNLEDLSVFLRSLPKNYPRFLLGLGSNIIFRDGFYNGVVIKLGEGFNNFELNDYKLKIGAGAKNINIVKYTLSKKITGFEFLIGIPGSLGGSLKMNSSCFSYCISDNLLNVNIMNENGVIKSFNKKELEISYRNCELPKDHIFIDATFKIKYANKNNITNRIQNFKMKRKNSQPLGVRTGGSTFVNPDTVKAWQLIEKSGLRGKKFGDAMISDKHCNFLINLGKSTSTELEVLGEDIIETVFKKKNIKLNWEIKRVGNFKKI